MTRRSLALAISFVLSSAGCAQDTPAPTAPDASKGQQSVTDTKTGTPSDFARFVAADTGGHFDVAITTYRNEDGVTVRLFAAVHIADGSHYEALQRRFAGCGRLLYELVGPEDYRPRRGESRGGMVSMLQQGMKSGLELEFQLDGVDYGAENFVHADMTPEEFEASMDERGETLFSMMLQMGFDAQSRVGKPQEEGDDTDVIDEAGADRPRQKPFDLIQAFRSGEGRHQLRLMMAQQLEALEGMSSGRGTTLLEGRNEKCLTVLKREIAAGHKDLGIYYGAAHLTHMEKRLTEDLGFRKVDHEWIVAWDCTKRPDPKFDRELFRARRKAKDEVASLRAAVRKWTATQEGEGAPPSFEQLEWNGARVDPWGNPYSIDVVDGECDVTSLGQDGTAGTGDDLHAASPRERSEMDRKRKVR